MSSHLFTLTCSVHNQAKFEREANKNSRLLCVNKTNILNKKCTLDEKQNWNVRLKNKLKIHFSKILISSKASNQTRDKVNTSSVLTAIAIKNVDGLYEKTIEYDQSKCFQIH